LDNETLILNVSIGRYWVILYARFGNKGLFGFWDNVD